MQYKPYQHICRLGTDDTEGILNGTVYITTKIDGCFSSKQTVLMADGSSKPISKLKVGDFVYSYNLATNTVEIKPVTNIYCHVCEPTTDQAQQWLKIKFSRRKYNNLYSKQSMSNAYMYVTKNHNIFVKRNGLIVDVPADTLVVGDIVINITKIEIPQEISPTVVENEILSVEQCHVDDFYRGNFGTVQKTFKKYDLEVADNHNYFVGGILVHNSNCCIFRKDDGTVGVGSRKREITPLEDNQGCASYVLSQDKFKKFLDAHPNCILFSEWLIKVHIKSYNPAAWRKIYVFDVLEVQDGGNARYVPYEEYVPWLEEFGILYIPLVAKIENPTEEDLVRIMDEAHFLQDESGANEGIVLRNYQYRNQFGRQTWAKVIRKEFIAGKTKKEVVDPHHIEIDIVDKFCTEAFIEKEYAKLAAEGWQTSMIPRLLNTIWHEFVVEESWNFIKKYKNPTIDFKILNHLVIQKIKAVKGGLFNA